MYMIVCYSSCCRCSLDVDSTSSQRPAGVPCSSRIDSILLLMRVFVASDDVVYTQCWNCRGLGGLNPVALCPTPSDSLTFVLHFYFYAHVLRLGVKKIPHEFKTTNAFVSTCTLGFSTTASSKKVIARTTDNRK